MTDFDALIRETGIAAINELNSSAAAIGEAMTCATEAARRLPPAERELFAFAIKGRLKLQGVPGLTRLVDRAIRDASAATSPAEKPGTQGGKLIREIEPWPEPVDGVELLSELIGAIGRFVCMSREALAAVALWVIHTHAIEAAEISPRLAITSPTKRCGKSRLCRVLGELVARPLSMSNVTPAVVFRVVDAQHPTLVIDEADSFMGLREELRNLLNAGYARDDANVFRCVGDDFEPVCFSAWAPVAIAAIGDLPDTVMDRSIRVELARKGTHENVERYQRKAKHALRVIARRCARWVRDNEARLSTASPRLPPELHDRAADNWEPLLAIADECGREWPERARHAAVAMETRTKDTAVSSDLAELLIRDIAEQLRVGTLAEPVFMQDIVAVLGKLEDRPWRTCQRDRPLDTHFLGRLLRPFHINARSVRRGRLSRKGFQRGAFDDTFARYLPKDSVTSVTRAGLQGKGGASASGVVPAPKPEDLKDSGRVTGVTGHQGKPRKRR